VDAEKTLDRFEAAWQRDEPPEIADFVDFAAVWSTDGGARRDLVVELVMIDLWYRWRQASRGRVAMVAQAASNRKPEQATADSLPDRPRLEDYVRAYPELGSLEDLPPVVIGEEYRARRQWGDRPSHADYLGRFRHQASRLEELLPAIDGELAEDTVASRETSTSEGTPVTTDSASSVARPAPPAMIGKYHVIGVLEEGGQAQVYRAIHPTLSKELVIKLGRRPMGSHPTDQLVAEGKLLAELEHPNLARIYDMDFHENRPYLVMEYVRGRNLRQCARQQRYSPRDAALLVAKIARALTVPHARGIVHQDLKPGNIIIDESGEPRVIDFGLARLLPVWVEDSDDAPGSISGTVQYMSPEQARGETENIDPRSDVFALGAVLYFLLVGRSPFADQSVMASLERAQECDFDRAALRRAGVPRALEAVCLRAMQAEPDRRYSSVEAMACELERAVAEPRCLKRILAAVVGTAAVAAVAFGLWSMRGDKPVGPDPIPPVVSETERIDPARDVLGRPLRHDFPLEFEVLGHDVGEDHRVVLTEGEHATFRIEAERDCFVGIWLVDQDNAPIQLFPDEHDNDHFVAAGEPRIVRGGSGYAFTMTASEGPEYLHVVAFSERWEAPSGPRQGFVTPDEISQWRPPVKSVKIEKDQSPPMAELFLLLHVRPKPEESDSEAEKP